MQPGRRSRGLPNAICFALFVIAPCVAQQQAGTTFDISSVKAANGKSLQGNIRRLDVGILSVSSMTLNDMIELFYNVRPYQIIAGPGWIKQDRYDVVGKDSTNKTAGQKLSDSAWSAAIDASYEQMRLLLKDRFALSTHHESRVLPGLSLLLDKKPPPFAVPCSSPYWLQHGLVRGAIHTSSLAALLKAELGMPVIDRTELTGCYDMDAHWTTDPNEESLPTIPTALHDLGFRLAKARGNVDVLVIDHVEKPQLD